MGGILGVGLRAGGKARMVRVHLVRHRCNFIISYRYRHTPFTRGVGMSHDYRPLNLLYVTGQ
jgi:hypothetical protein